MSGADSAAHLHRFTCVCGAVTTSADGDHHEVAVYNNTHPNRTCYHCSRKGPLLMTCPPDCNKGNGRRALG